MCDQLRVLSSNAMNPYASYLGSQDPMEVIPATPARLNQLVDTLGAKAEIAPGPGKWSAREIICHLADTEIAFGFRLRQALAEPHHVIQPFDQDSWAVTYAAYDTAAALHMFAALRDWNVKLIKSVVPGALSKPLMHPERGEMTFQTLIETMGGHDLNHVAQLEKIAA